MVGFGTFAQFLAKTMINRGHTLRATSRTDYTQLSKDMGVSFVSDVGALLQEDNDVIMICTSILSFSTVLGSMPLHLLRLPVLFVDVLSVKEHPRDILLKVLPERADILCTHPMFGPESGKYGWKDLNFMYERVRIRGKETCSSFLQIFEMEGCRMLEMSCTNHDSLAAKSQFITHVIGRTLSEMEIESTPIDTKGFETLVQLRKNTEKNSYDLFNGLYKHNKFAKQELKNIELALEKVKQKLQKNDEE
ncbi:hypothetical protein MLD38_003631 [Melastoma candidum]|uniref:Uncharacterized protein n=1 Tax=Melastoma candidum TaxID=119954 RepID=A0ACB9S568_9MYRT|nr:hypothetical protein MLD38_003631 [Melastoma candidum]